jgi:hypothetical protein
MLLCRILLLLASVISICWGSSTLFAANSPARLKRSESFLGIHFDFHAGRDSAVT